MQRSRRIPKQGAFAIPSVPVGADVSIGDGGAYGMAVNYSRDDAAVYDVVGHRGVVRKRREPAHRNIAFPTRFDIQTVLVPSTASETGVAEQAVLNMLGRCR